MRYFPSFLVVLLFCSCSSADEPSLAHLHGLVVIKPDAHRQGLPPVFLTEQADEFIVEIPNTVHVHRYYFSGHREFQAPIIQGGPTTIVANHPQTGKRMYIETVLPPGAPRLVYTDHSITYLYQQQRIVIVFNRGDEAVTVKRHKGRGFWRKAKEKSHKAFDTMQTHMASSASMEALSGVAQDGGRFAVGVKEALDTLVARTVGGAHALTDAIPGVTAIRSQADERAQRNYETIVDRATREQESEGLEFVRTNR